MNLPKIGKFISECRKDKKLTQEQLAEKLSITDRAVSKWERGLSLPDASIMLKLCNILDINVNELLIGEKVDIKDEKKKTEELLIEITKQDEFKNKKLMTSIRTILITNIIFYIGILFLALNVLKKGTLLGIIICISTVIFVITIFAALKFEIDAGYYECQKCHHKFIPTYKEAMIMPHMVTIRYLKCPKCHQRTWSKKVMSK